MPELSSFNADMTPAPGIYCHYQQAYSAISATVLKISLCTKQQLTMVSKVPVTDMHLQQNNTSQEVIPVEEKWYRN